MGIGLQGVRIYGFGGRLPFTFALLRDPGGDVRGAGIVKLPK